MITEGPWDDPAYLEGPCDDSVIVREAERGVTAEQKVMESRMGSEVGGRDRKPGIQDARRWERQGHGFSQ